MIYCSKKLDYAYFKGNDVETYSEDYIYEDMNINISIILLKRMVK